VRTCSLNPRENEYYVSEDVWTRIIREQRREKLKRYWAELEAEVREALAVDASIRQIMRDLGIEGLLREATFDDQMAQLRGMGFVDEAAMRRALGEAAGDVAGALELL